MYMWNALDAWSWCIWLKFISKYGNIFQPTLSTTKAAYSYETLLDCSDLCPFSIDLIKLYVDLIEIKGDLSAIGRLDSIWNWKSFNWKTLNTPIMVNSQHLLMSKGDKQNLLSRVPYFPFKSLIVSWLWPKCGWSN